LRHRDRSTLCGHCNRALGENDRKAGAARHRKDFLRHQSRTKTRIMSLRQKVTRSATNDRRKIRNGKKDNAAMQSANINAHPKERWRLSMRRSRSKSILSKTEHHDV
jgi:hypothetical protein